MAGHNSKDGTVARHGRRQNTSAKLETRPAAHDFRREKHGVEEEVMENPKRASRWPDVAWWRAIHGGAMADAGDAIGSRPTKHH